MDVRRDAAGRHSPARPVAILHDLLVFPFLFLLWRHCLTTITLDSIRAAAEAKYGSTDIAVGDTTVRLLNPLRLPKSSRDALRSVQGRLDGEDVDQEALLAEAITLVAENTYQARLLLDAVGGDLAVLAEIFAAYGKGTQAGEASASPSS